MDNQGNDEFANNCARQNLIFENVNEAVVYVDVKGRIVNANHNITKFIGYSQKEIIGKRFTSLGILNKETLSKMIKLFKDVLLKRKLVNVIDLEIKRKDGTKINVEVIINPIVNNNKINGFVNIIRDVSERSRINEELTKMNKSYSIITELTGQVIYDYDIKSGLIEWKGAITKVTGYSPLEFSKVGINEWSRMIHPDDKINALRLLDSAMKKSEKYDMEYRFLNKNNEYSYIKDSGIFLPDSKGKALRMIGVLKDITEEKSRLSDIERLRRDEEINRARKDFLMLITHELKQPLTPIMGYADLLKEDIIDIDKLKYLDRIINGAQEMYDLISRILNLMRLETGQLVFNFKQIELESLINDSLTKRASIINLKSIKIVRNVKRVKFVGDYNLLREVIVNLLDNAIKFSLDKSIVEVDARKVGKRIVISVKDYGVGINEEDIPKLFKTFSQTVEGRRHGGFGIGLALCKMIIENHKGMISVKSTPGKGSNFIISIPGDLSESN